MAYGGSPGRVKKVGGKDKKYKSVRCFKGDKEMFFDSIGAFCEHFGIYRKKFSRIVSSGRTIDGWFVRYLDSGDAPWAKKC